MLNNSDKGLSDNWKKTYLSIRLQKGSIWTKLTWVKKNDKNSRNFGRTHNLKRTEISWRYAFINHILFYLFLYCIYLFFSYILYCFSAFSAYVLCELISPFEGLVWLLIIPIFVLAIAAWGAIILLITKLIEKQLKKFSPREIYLKRSLPQR